ncbi:hypothetical protein QBC35DRAFT_382015, partial [Podospora australis]
YLWVSLVVRSLVEGLTEGDTLIDLQATLSKLPSDIMQLYGATWKLIRPEYISQPSELLQICAVANASLTPVLLYYALQDQWLTPGEDAFTVDRMNYITEVMRRRLNSRTRGLLDVSANRQVEFLHRSVGDWIKLMWPEICAKTAPELDPHLVLFKVHFNAALSISIPYWKESVKVAAAFLYEFWAVMSTALKHAVQVGGAYEPNVVDLVTGLDRLDEYMTIVFKLTRDDGPDCIPHLYFEAFGASPEFRQRHVINKEPLPHWSTTQYYDYLNCRYYTFLGFTVHVAITPYVRYKYLSSKPRCFQELCEASTGGEYVTVFESAIFGFLYPPGQAFKRPYSSFYPECRYELVSFFLKNGARPSTVSFKEVQTQSATASTSDTTPSEGLSIYERAKQRPFEVEEEFKVGSGDYWGRDEAVIGEVW